MTRWIVDHLGAEVPLHFTAFHPAYKLNDISRTPAAILQQARHNALANGLKHVYLGNVHDREGGITVCATCGEPLIERDWHRILHYRLDADGACPHCRSLLAGRFDSRAEDFGPRRIPVHLA